MFTCGIIRRNIGLFLFVVNLWSFLSKFQTLKAKKINIRTQTLLFFLMNFFGIDLIQFKTFYIFFSWYNINRYLSKSNLIVLNVYLSFIFMLRLQNLKIMLVLFLHKLLLIFMHLYFKSILYRSYYLCKATLIGLVTGLLDLHFIFMHLRFLLSKYFKLIGMFDNLFE